MRKEWGVDERKTEPAVLAPRRQVAGGESRFLNQGNLSYKRGKRRFTIGGKGHYLERLCGRKKKGIPEKVSFTLRRGPQ